MKIVITGATGFIGSKITASLLSEAHHVVALTRNPARAGQALGDPGVGTLQIVQANLEQSGAWQQQLAAADAVIHLAGESVGGKRWDARQKQVLRDSRVEATRVLVEGIAALPAEQRPKALISSSGADYYAFAESGSFDDDACSEQQPSADHFLGRLCRDWEKEANAAEALNVRVVTMRTGIVLGKEGGAMEKINKAFKFFLGGPMGSGQQWFSWIHIDDVVNAYLFALRDQSVRGPLNLVAPGAVRQIEFAQALGKAMGRPSFMPTPGFALRMAVGSEFAEYLLNGRKVVPSALLHHGFIFTHPKIETAVRG